MPATTLWPRHNVPTSGVMVYLVIQLIVLSFTNSIQGRVFQQNIAHPHTTVVSQRALQSVGMLPWSARPPDLSQIEHVWDIIERQLQYHPQAALTVQVLTQHVQNPWNSIPQSGIRHLHDTMHTL
ncbi:uncharacterized protein TNCV_1664021 [Trichonephila clavipes]|uniref:Tc1-like transposase DDE domain-containing protein n=1 Tax=Trichonephila clavipes TaxID=2585209 RepID=A0A8X6S4I1_TRICX|nr:uncharacterized protein TNCV_1664021 [Trichonephila clavipes]